MPDKEPKLISGTGNGDVATLEIEIQIEIEIGSRESDAPD